MTEHIMICVHQIYNKNIFDVGIYNDWQVCVYEYFDRIYKKKIYVRSLNSSTEFIQNIK